MIPMKFIIILLFTFQILFKNYKTHLKKKIAMRLFGFVELCFAVIEGFLDFPYFLSFS
jgi:hypothetical protein